jgi:membrane associated rhomboid family serine protease
VTVLLWLGGWCYPVGPHTHPLTILTYAFSHYGFWHLALNMWALWVFGNPVNRRLGNFYYACTYLGSVVVLGLLGRLLTACPLMGASGAVFAVAAVALILKPAALLEIAVVVFFPLSLVIGLFRRPEHPWQWLVRGAIYAIPALSALVIVALVQLFSFWWDGWCIASLTHLLGIACGVVAVVLLPARITMPGRLAADLR